MNTPPIPTSRRDFLATAGLTTAAFSVPNIARAADAAGPKLRIGIIGCGGRSNNVGDMAVKDGRYEIVALADYFQDAVDRQGEKFGVPAKARFTGLDCFQKMIEAGNIDIVAVLTPPYFHPEQVEAAVEAGLHVYLAKPIAIDSQGVARIEAAAKKAAAKKRCVLVDFQTRALKHFHEAARRVAAGDLGTPGYAEIEGTSLAFRNKVPPGTPEARLRNWLQWRALCGEALIEFSIHSIDMASLLIGRNPVSATGFCDRLFVDHNEDTHPGDVKDVFNAVYDYGDGFKSVLRSKRFNVQGVSGGIHVDVFGADGALSADYSGEVYIKGKKPFSGDRFMEKKIRGIYNIGIINNWATFYQNITTGDYAQATVKPSAESHYLALLAREACYKQGATVTWDDVVNDKTAIEFDRTGLNA